MTGAPGRADVRCVVLSGGVGGSKLALGLARVLAPGELLCVANTGDDFEHLGLRISPDLDTLTYTLAGINDPVTGWGRADETWSFMETLAALGGETWFRLGDRDLALHVERTRRLKNGETLSAIAADVAARLGVRQRIVPMSDDGVATVVETAEGPLPFQHYFVRERARPAVTGFRYAGAERARPAAALLEALAALGLEAVVICPSNPFISIDPILSMPGVRAALREAKAPVVAVSPIVGGAAVKGPTAKMMTELGIEVSPVAVARHYQGLIDALVIDRRDEACARAVRGLGVECRTAATVMRGLADRDALARVVLELAARIAVRG